MTDLKALLDLATDAIDTPSLARGALDTAGRRRGRRRMVAATALTVLLVGCVAVGIQAGTTVRSEAPVAPSPSVSTPSVAPPIDAAVVQAPWDPAGVAGLPTSRGVALPADLDRPGDASPLDDAPFDAAVAALETDAGIGLVGADGSWRYTPCPEVAAEQAVVPVALSPDGTRLGFLGRTRLWWRDLGAPWRSVAYPAGMDPEAQTYGRRLSMPTRGRIDVGYDPSERGTERAWAVDLDDGSARRLPFRMTESLAQRGEVSVRMGPEDDGRRLLRTWRGFEEDGSPLDIAVFDDLANPVLGSGGVVAGRMVNSYAEPRAGSDLDGLLAFDPDDGSARAYLPFAGDDGFGWALQGVQPMGWVDGERVLLLVSTQSTADLVTWDVGTGALARVSSYDASSRLAVAVDLLAGS